MKVFGIHTVREFLLRRPQQVSELVLLAAPKMSPKHQQLLALAREHTISHRMLKEAAFISQLSVGAVHQGVYAVVEPPQFPGLDQLLSNHSQSLKLVVLDCVQDPHNLGACMRTSCAMGIDAIIIPKHKSVSVNETALKVACGAGSWLPVYEVSNLAQTLKKLQEQGVWCVGTSEHAEQNLTDLQLTDRSLAIVVGNEARGVRRLTLEHCDYLVKLPTVGPIQSLNVSVALGMVLYHCCGH